MALTTLSFKEAQKIIDLYASILIHSENLGLNNRFRYSQLKGYDIYDIDNALKLTSAYRVFNCKERSDTALSKLREATNVDGGASMSFFNLFEPDNIVQQLNKIDLSNPTEAIIKQREIRGDYFQSQLWKDFSKTETHESFLNFCLQLDMADRDYWEKIYDRLGITWDDRDEYDEIYFVIQNKDYYFKNKEIPGLAPPEPVDKPLTVEEKSPSFYTRYKLFIDNIIGLILLAVGLVYIPIRIAVFAILGLTGIITLVILRKEKIDNKLNHYLNYLYIVVYAVGIIFQEAGFYICVAAIVWTLFTFIKGIISLQKVNPETAAGTS